ncbi:hypothetical protein CRYUN_Cryun21dG0040200 [Craigia yunnanensis]
MYSTNHQNSHPPPYFEQQAPAPVVTVNLTNQNCMQTAGNFPWSTGLFDCFSDVPNCCITCCCPCITFGKIAEIIDQQSCFRGACGTLYAFCLFTGCACIYSSSYRSRLRDRYMLEASPCGDCCVHFFCEPCALCQEYRQLQNSGFDMSLGWHGNMQRNQNRGVPTAPVVVSGMTR